MTGTGNGRDEALPPGADDDSSQERLRRAEALQRALTELPDTTVFLLDRDLQVLVAEGEAVRKDRSGLARELLGGRALRGSSGEVPAGPGVNVLEQCRAALGGEPRSFAWQAGGRWFDARAVPVDGPSGAIEWVLLTVRDVTRQRQVEAELARRVEQQAAVAGLGQLAIDDRDPSGIIDRIVSTVASVLGTEFAAVMALDEETGRLELAAGHGFPAGVAGAYSAPAGGRSQTALTLSTLEPVVVEDYEAETRFERHPMLAGLGVRSGASVVVGGTERPYGVLAVLGTAPRHLTPHDVDFLRSVANLLSATLQRNADEERYRHAALHDPLTELPNRALMLDRLSLALSRRERENTGVAVLLLDLDGFKVINDSLGHGEGDRVLLALAPRLRAAVRANDSVGRLGGDEFVAVCEVAGGAGEAAAIARRIADAIARPVELPSGTHQMTASVGIALAISGEDTPESLLRDADAAMYRAKARGRGRIELFDDVMRERVLRRLRIEGELREAIAGDQLRVFYQPIFDVGTGRAVAVEALMRWDHPDRGLLTPADFLPVAEETGLIVQAGRLVLEQACRQVAVWQRRFHSPLRLSVNVSSRQLAKPGFAREVDEVVRASGLAHRTLGLEATETVLLEEAGADQPALSALVRQGLRLQLDGFGTGYSSLAFLRRFPLEALKIDRSLVVDIEHDRAAAAIVEAVIGMSASLGVDAVVEGIENQDQLDRVVILGAQRVQGFHLARPLPAGELEPLLAQALGGGEAA